MAGYSIEEFEREIKEIYPRLNRAMTAYLAGSGVDPEDIIQEAFLKAFRNLDKFKGGSGLYTWIYSIARNLCIDEFRKRKHQQNRSQIPVEDFELASDIFTSETVKEEVILLRKAISELPENLREILVMQAIDEMSYADISRITVINEQTLKNRTFRARKQLAEILKKMGISHN